MSSADAGHDPTVHRKREATPVMKRAASEARKSEAWATSQALPMPPLSGLQVSRVAAISSRGLP